jgi:peptidylprolyl isomerase
MRTVVNGDMVTVHYTGTLENGEVFDTSIGGEPLKFQVGSGQIIQGFNDAVIGMEIGTEKTFSLDPDMAYGYRDDELVRNIPRSVAGSQFKPEVGMTIGIQMEDGTKMPANITQVTDDSITIDMNPPLAGKTLNFKIQVVDISDASSCGCGCGSSCGSGGGGSSSCGCC